MPSQAVAFAIACGSDGHRYRKCLPTLPQVFVNATACVGQHVLVDFKIRAGRVVQHVLVALGNTCWSRLPTHAVVSPDACRRVPQYVLSSPFPTLAVAVFVACGGDVMRCKEDSWEAELTLFFLRILTRRAVLFRNFVARKSSRRHRSVKEA